MESLANLKYSWSKISAPSLLLHGGVVYIFAYLAKLIQYTYMVNDPVLNSFFSCTCAPLYLIFVTSIIRFLSTYLALSRILVTSICCSFICVLSSYSTLQSILNLNLQE